MYAHRDGFAFSMELEGLLRGCRGCILHIVVYRASKCTEISSSYLNAKSVPGFPTYCVALLACLLLLPLDVASFNFLVFLEWLRGGAAVLGGRGIASQYVRHIIMLHCNLLNTSGTPCTVQHVQTRQSMLQRSVLATDFGKRKCRLHWEGSLSVWEAQHAPGAPYFPNAVTFFLQPPV